MKPAAGLAHDQMCSVKQRWVIMTQVSRLQCRRHLAVEMFPGNGTQRKVTEEWWISVSSSRLVWAMTRASINLSHLSRARFRVRKEEVLVLSLQRVLGPLWHGGLKSLMCVGWNCCPLKPEAWVCDICSLLFITFLGVTFYYFFLTSAKIMMLLIFFF